MPRDRPRDAEVSCVCAVLNLAVISHGTTCRGLIHHNSNIIFSLFFTKNTSIKNLEKNPKLKILISPKISLLFPLNFLQ